MGQGMGIYGAGLTLELLPKHGEEDGEVNGAARLLDHGVQLLVLHVQAPYGGRLGSAIPLWGHLYPYGVAYTPIGSAVPLWGQPSHYGVTYPPIGSAIPLWGHLYPYGVPYTPMGSPIPL